MNAQKVTQSIIDQFKGVKGEFYMLKGLLCADLKFASDSKEFAAYRSIIDGMMIAERMDEIQKAELDEIRKDWKK